MKCGYERKTNETATDSQCPGCGTFYAKTDAAFKKNINNLIKQENPKVISSPYESNPTNLDTGQIVGVIGSIILFIGVFAPIISIPVMGNINYFQNGKADGAIVLVLSLISLAAVFLKKQKWLIISGVISLSILLYTFSSIKTLESTVKSTLESELKGNPFASLATMAAQSIQIQWGWALLIIGTGLVIASAILNKVELDKLTIGLFFMLPVFCFISPIAIPKYHEYMYKTYGSDEVMQYRKDAEKGSATAQFNLGISYYAGKGIPKNEVLAIEWFRKSAEQGYAPAQFNLGAMYSSGSGTAKDEDQAVEWFRKSAEQGYEDAQFNLAIHYESGRGLSKDEETAFDWYFKAAQQGNADAQFKVGSMFYKGKGVDQDIEEAKLWFRKAADQGHKDALSVLNSLF